MADILKASVSGIRGTIGGSLTPQAVVAWTAAYAAWLGSSGTVAVGRDTRKSGPLCQRLVEASLQACGITVIDIGIVPTPTLLFHVREQGLDGGILLTASHNPIEWNALKLVKRGGVFLEQPDFEALCRMKENPPCWVSVHELGGLQRDPDAAAAYGRQLASRFDTGAVRAAGFSVAVDPAGGAGAVLDRAFLEGLGCTVHGIHEAITGDFPRRPEPVPEALTDLAAFVRERKAAVGFAQDPDADRLVLVDETGTPVSEELTLALCLLSWYSRGGRGDAVVNMSTSRVNDAVAARFGFAVHRAKVGEANVLTRMRELAAPIGGEGNGGIILPELNPCRDSFVGMLLVLDLLAREKRPLSAIVASLPQYQMVKEKFPVTLPADAEALLVNAFRAVGETEFTVNREDGLRFDFPAGWIHVRESNTEPVVRLIAESREECLTYGWIRAAATALGL